jgi:UDP-N-acetylmuramate dehydrogenase
MPNAIADFCTLRVGGFADDLVIAQTEVQLIEAVQSADAAGIPVLLVGGGSNIVVADDGFRGRVVLVRTAGFTSEADSCGGAIVTVEAGHDWDEFVAQTLANGWSGIEAMSGIPGTVGATPIQNVGAYGQEVGDWIYRVRTWDRMLQEFKTFSASECEFSYRDSRFKREPNRYLILQVSFQLRLGDHSAPVMYDELARLLEVEPGKRSKSNLVREKVLQLREAKGMVLAQVDHDTWSVGSFFTNPVLQIVPAAVPATAPQWKQLDGTTKLSAAWLVENAGYAKGFGLNDRVTLSTKHSLAITNRGAATANDIFELARLIQNGVKQKFGINLEIEPSFVGNFG